MPAPVCQSGLSVKRGALYRQWIRPWQEGNGTAVVNRRLVSAPGPNQTQKNDGLAQQKSTPGLPVR